jgi:beta-glucosidase/6-phospho-beta-glucosidase/beta-galactosidase
MLDAAQRIRLWPPETVRLVQQLSKLEPGGIFSTGIENSDPWVGEMRRDQIREAFDFRLNWRQRLRNIKSLGIDWVRFGEGYSFVHLGPEQFNFDLTDKVVAECETLGINFIADFLHFGLPAWLHAACPATPFFQNPTFPEHFARYAAAFARRYPYLRYFTPVNEPYFTIRSSAKEGRWNEHIAADEDDDRAYVRGCANIARAAILRVAKSSVFGTRSSVRTSRSSFKMIVCRKPTRRAAAVAPAKRAALTCAAWCHRI